MMEYIYYLMETALPFEFMKYDFMKNALLAIVLITPLFAMVGTMVVNSKLAFFSDALGHSALTGIALGTIFGLKNPLAAMIGFAVIFALFLSYIKEKDKSSEDTLISVFSSASIALGLVILSGSGSFSKYSSYLVGDILSVSASDILFLAIAFVCVLAVWHFIYNKLLIVSINPSMAKSKNINVRLTENIFLVLVAVIVTVSIKWVGILVINSLLIIPCAAAKNVAKSMRSYQNISIAIGLFSGVSGLILSYYLNTAAGPTVVLISAVVFFASVLYKSIKRI